MVQREGGSFCLGKEGSCVNQTGWSNASSSPIYRADGLVSRLPGARRETTVLKVWRIEREGAGLWEGLAQRGESEGGGGEEEAARVLFLQSLSPVFVSHTLLLAMPSLLVLAGIMEKNGGYGGDLAGSGFGSEGLLVPPDEEEDDSRALRVALGQLSLLGLGEGEDGGGAPTTGVQDRSNNNNNHHNHTNSVGGGGDTAILQGKSKLCALYESSSTETKGRGCNITECVPVPSSEHVAEIVGRQGKPPPTNDFPPNLSFSPATSLHDPAAVSCALCFLFSNCYLVLFDKEKGVVWLLACFFVLPRDISLPLFSATTLQVLLYSLLRSHAETMRPLCVFVFISLLREFAKRLERARFPPGRMIPHPRHQCQRTDTGAGRALASFVV